MICVKCHTFKASSEFVVADPLLSLLHLLNGFVWSWDPLPGWSCVQPGAGLRRPCRSLPTGDASRRQPWSKPGWTGRRIQLLWAQRSVGASKRFCCPSNSSFSVTKQSLRYVNPRFAPMINAGKQPAVKIYHCRSIAPGYPTVLTVIDGPRGSCKHLFVPSACLLICWQ